MIYIVRKKTGGYSIVTSAGGYSSSVGSRIDNTTDWGEIKGNISNQTDLSLALDSKQEKLISGSNIKTVEGESILGEGDIVIDLSEYLKKVDAEIIYATKSTTLSGYGISDAYTKQSTDELLNNKVTKIDGKGLSTNDYTTDEKTKLTGIETGAQVNVLEGVMINDNPITIDENKHINIITTDNTSPTESSLATKRYVDSIRTLEVVSVDELPEASADTMDKIYLVPSPIAASQNIKDEYITLRSGTEGSYTYTWEQIGSTEIDLSNYVQKEDGKELYPVVDKTKLAGIETGAEVNKIESIKVNNVLQPITSKVANLDIDLSNFVVVNELPTASSSTMNKIYFKEIPSSSGVDWNTYEWVGSSTGIGVNTYKVQTTGTNPEVVNIQWPGFAAEQGIYVIFTSAISSINIPSAAVQGGGVLVYLSGLTKKETKIVVTCVEGTYTFYIYNKNGEESSAAPTHESYVTQYYDNKYFWEKIGGSGGSAPDLSDYLKKTDAESTYAKKATTLSGYGITDAYTKSTVDNTFAKKATTLSGYGITDAYTKSEVNDKITSHTHPISGVIGLESDLSSINTSLSNKINDAITFTSIVGSTAINLTSCNYTKYLMMGIVNKVAFTCETIDLNAHYYIEFTANNGWEGLTIPNTITWVGDSLNVVPGGTYVLEFIHGYMKTKFAYVPDRYHFLSGYTSWYETDDYTQMTYNRLSGVYEYSLHIDANDNKSFKIKKHTGDNNGWYGISSFWNMTRDNCTDWYVDTGMGSDIGINPDVSGTYKIIYNASTQKVSVIFP